MGAHRVDLRDGQAYTHPGFSISPLRVERNCGDRHRIGSVSDVQVGQSLASVGVVSFNHPRGSPGRNQPRMSDNRRRCQSNAQRWFVQIDYLDRFGGWHIVKSEFSVGPAAHEHVFPVGQPLHPVHLPFVTFERTYDGIDAIFHFSWQFHWNMYNNTWTQSWVVLHLQYYHFKRYCPVLVVQQGGGQCIPP